MSFVPDVALMIPGPAGALEARWSAPATPVTEAAVVCHPHPLHGGTMGNKVVTTVARSFRDADLPVLTFNFRGVGRSEGVHSHGVGEVEDLLAVLTWLQAQGVTRVHLAGFSFGSWVCAAAVSRLPATLTLAGLVLVAPPVHYEGFAVLQPPTGTVVLMGDQDEVVDADAMRAWAESRHPPCELKIFSGAGHFFHGRLTELKAELALRLTH
jgi:alpha/beta superfamily hydrolase